MSQLTAAFLKTDFKMSIAKMLFHFITEKCHFIKYKYASVSDN